MKATTGLLLLASLSGCTVGCMGAPFSLPPTTIEAGEGLTADDGGTQDGRTDPVEADAAVESSSPPDASPQDAAADAAEEPPAVVCSPVTATPHDVCPAEPSAPDPFPTCYDRLAQNPVDGGCPTINACEPTPGECQCRESFTCACLKAHGVNWKNCVDVGGAPWTF